MKTKKILTVMILLFITSFIMAQEKLSDYLNMLNDLTNQEIAITSEFNLVYQSAINELNTDTQVEMAKISKEEKLAWETEAKYTTRISEEINKLQTKRDKEIESITNEIKASFKERQDYVTNKKQEIIYNLMKKEFVYTGNSVQISFGKFSPSDTNDNHWPVVVKSLEKDLNFTANNLKWILDSNTIEQQYKSSEKMILNNEIKGEIYFQVIRKTLTDTYQKKVTKVILRAPNNAVLVEFPIDEIVETFSLTQTVYEPSSIITE